jgi:hypothetical protein
MSQLLEGIFCPPQVVLVAVFHWKSSGKTARLREGKKHIQTQLTKKCGKFKSEHFLPLRKKLTDSNIFEKKICNFFWNFSVKTQSVAEQPASVNKSSGVYF